MDKTLSLIRHEQPKLTIVKKYKVAEFPARMIHIKKDKKAIVLLPPAPEQYIRTKNHDFL